MPSPSAHTCMNGLVVSASACADSSSGMVLCIGDRDFGRFTSST